MPISLIRCDIVNADNPNNPRHAIKMAMQANVVNIVFCFSSDLYKPVKILIQESILVRHFQVKIFSRFFYMCQARQQDYCLLILTDIASIIIGISRNQQYKRNDLLVHGFKMKIVEYANQFFRAAVSITKIFSNNFLIGLNPNAALTAASLMRKADVSVLKSLGKSTACNHFYAICMK